MFSKILSFFRTFWSRFVDLKLSQQIILGGIAALIVVSLVAIMLVGGVHSQASKERSTLLFQTPITDPQARQRISLRLDKAGIGFKIVKNQFFVSKPSQMLLARTILISEDLLPDKVDPWSVFSKQSWTVTNFERQVNLKRAWTKRLELSLESLSDVDKAVVTLVTPKKALFSKDQQPATASVIITPHYGSDLTQNKNKIQGIQRVVMASVEGLTPKNITITDNQGNVLNDFAGMEYFNKLKRASLLLQEKHKIETQYRKQILTQLGSIFTPARIRIVNLDIDLQMVDASQTTKEVLPVVIKKDNPNTPYDDSKVVPEIVVSEQTTNKKFQGTGFNPEGPPGDEGQTPPAYKDLNNLVGKYSDQSNVKNYDYGTRTTKSQSSPYRFGKVSVAVAIDGLWQDKLNAKGKPLLKNGVAEKTYTPLTQKTLDQATSLVQAAVGFSKARGDMVSVQNIAFDHSAAFRAYSDKIARRVYIERLIVIVTGGVVLTLLIFFLYNIARDRAEARRQAKEEELSRRLQQMREQALTEADVETEEDLSPQDAAQMQLFEFISKQVSERPKDVVTVIRTWLREES